MIQQANPIPLPTLKPNAAVQLSSSLMKLIRQVINALLMKKVSRAEHLKTNCYPHTLHSIHSTQFTGGCFGS